MISSSQHAAGVLNCNSSMNEQASIQTFLFTSRTNTSQKDPLFKKVDVDFVPIFLGGVMQNQNNRPPITIPSRSCISLSAKHDQAINRSLIRSQPLFNPMLTINRQRNLHRKTTRTLREALQDPICRLIASTISTANDQHWPSTLRDSEEIPS